MKTQTWSPGVGKEAQFHVKEKIYVKTSKNCTNQSTATVDFYLHSTSVICSCKIQISFMNILFWCTDSIARTRQNHLWAFIILLQVRRGCFCSFIKERKVCLMSQSKNRTVITIKTNKTHDVLHQDLQVLWKEYMSFFSAAIKAEQKWWGAWFLSRSAKVWESLWSWKAKGDLNRLTLYAGSSLPSEAAGIAWMGVLLTHPN